MDVPQPTAGHREREETIHRAPWDPKAGMPAHVVGGNDPYDALGERV